MWGFFFQLITLTACWHMYQIRFWEESVLSSRTQHSVVSNPITKTTQSGIQGHPFWMPITTTSLGSNINQAFNFSYLTLLSNLTWSLIQGNIKMTRKKNKNTHWKVIKLNQNFTLVLGYLDCFLNNWYFGTMTLN